MRGLVSQTIPSHSPQSQRETRERAQDDAGDDAGRVREREIHGEQEVVDLAYSELDRQLTQARRSLARTEAQGVSGTHQSRGERDAYAVHYSSLVSSLEGVEDRLVFGRMDMCRAPDDAAGAAGSGNASAPSPGSGRGVGSSSPVTDGGRRHYVGRIGLQDAQHREVILDWRAPLARAFYQATASHPMGLVRRRHIDTRARQVLGVEDEVLDLSALGSEGAPEGSSAATVAAGELQGEGALIAAMSTARDGRMGDIVATIQAEQDRIVTSSGRGVLVVQGGPGTGKTAVALHRVAYLFYSERERLERSGVLLVGPSRTFLRYVEQVLPSLGETGVVSTTIGDLVPGIRATAQEDARVAEVKGRSLWVKALDRAVRGLQRVPEAPRTIEVQGVRLTLEPSDVREAASRARRGGKPHNLAREAFVIWLLERLTDQYAAATNQDASDADTRAWIREDIRTARDARREINLCWMPTTPQGLLERLWSRPALLEQVAPSLSDQERLLLRRGRFDAPGIQRNVLRGRSKSHRQRAPGHHVQAVLRMGQRHARQPRHHAQLPQQQPAAPLPQAAREQRHGQAVHQRRPHPLEAVGQPHPAQVADGGPVHSRLAQAERERAHHQQQRQPGRKAQRQHAQAHGLHHGAQTGAQAAGP